MIEIYKIIKKSRIKYSLPVKYSSTTCYRVYVDDKIVYEGTDVFKVLLNKKQVTKYVETKYPDQEFIFKNGGTMYCDY